MELYHDEYKQELDNTGKKDLNELLFHMHLEEIP
jgi:hypothetical protein